LIQALQELVVVLEERAAETHPFGEKLFVAYKRRNPAAALLPILAKRWHIFALEKVVPGHGDLAWLPDHDEVPATLGSVLSTSTRA